MEADVATLRMAVDPDGALGSGYDLKLNSYDLGVDIELADAVLRLRFEHPEVRCVVLTGDLDRVFCAGANIMMLRTSAHAFKVNFCKYTNETRLSIEDASAHSNKRFLAALNGTASGGGYELALACDRILLVDDRNSAVSFPEVPLLGVLPGTGGLTRITDKRQLRRDRNDVFATLAEGVKGKRAVEWNLVDAPIAGIEVPAGTYSLYTVPGEDEWQIIVNRAIDQWGHERFYTDEIVGPGGRRCSHDGISLTASPGWPRRGTRFALLESRKMPVTFPRHGIPGLGACGGISPEDAGQ